MSYTLAFAPRSNNKLFKKFIASTISSFRDKNVNIGKVFIPNSARRVNLEKYLVLTYKFVEVIYFKTRSASIIKYADFLETPFFFILRGPRLIILRIIQP